MSAHNTSFSIWLLSAIASFSIEEISSLVPVLHFGAAVAFSIALTVFTKAVFTSWKPHSHRALSEGAAMPSRLRGCKLNLTYLCCNLWVFLTNFL